MGAREHRRAHVRSRALGTGGYPATDEYVARARAGPSRSVLGAVRRRIVVARRSLAAQTKSSARASAADAAAQAQPRTVRASTCNGRRRHDAAASRSTVRGLLHGHLARNAHADGAAAAAAAARRR